MGGHLHQCENAQFGGSQEQEEVHMKIKILGASGLHASEVRAVERMEAQLRDSWFAYASLLVADDQGSMDLDTLVITHDRLLLVELKEWNGEIESSDGRWYLNGVPYGKSPYEIKRVHAIRLTRLLQQELQHKLGYFPIVEAHVVLCGSATPERLSTLAPAFVSPHGTGCSRYVDVLFTEEYAYATWQQSQDDLSQPLVMNVVEMSTVAEMLGLRPSKFLG